MNVYICTARIDMSGDISSKHCLVGAPSAETARKLSTTALKPEPPGYFLANGPLAVLIEKLSYEGEEPAVIRKL